MRKITTTAGSIFLVWLIFSPVIGIYLFSKTYPDSESATFIQAAIYVLLTYILLGILGYFLIKRTGGVFMDVEPKQSEWWLAINYAVLIGLLFNFTFTVATTLLNQLSRYISVSPDIKVAVGLILNPLILWLVIVFHTRNMASVPNGVMKRSFYSFLIINLFFLLTFKFMMNEFFVSIWDLILILDFIVFYSATKKYLKTVH